MHFNTLRYFYDKASGQNPSFYYRGPFLERFTPSILDMSQASPGMEVQQNMGKKISYMLVECFQNVIKHAEVLPEDETSISPEGMFSFKSLNGAFVINSINLVNNKDVDRLVGLVENVNSMNESDLKQYYLEKLRNNEINDKGGAGLGLIEMARKSGQKILHETEKLNDQYSLFHQQITLRRNGGDGVDYQGMLHESGEFYKRMTAENMVLFYKGDFNQKSIMPLLEMAEHKLHDKTAGQKRTLRAAHVTVEVLQNISKHARATDADSQRFGVFMMGKIDGALSILAGNIVPVSEKIFLEEKLDYLISLDHDELKELHRSTLRASVRFENKTNSGLGLIEVAQASSESLRYQFYPHGEDQYLFALQVII
ncbi:MAG: SiaB family protein kinase [Flavobacteriales bacterium]|nr:SiaB family protein kinase [Flavobacteriales bacterium]